MSRPPAATQASITAAGLNLTINTTNSAANLLNIDLAWRFGQPSVAGTQGGETLTVDGTSVVATTTGSKTVTHNAASTENLQIFAFAGDDTINVTPSVSDFDLC